MNTERKYLLEKIAEQKLNPDSLSKKAGIYIPSLSKFILGENNLTDAELLLLAQAMNVTRPWLITGENGPAPKGGSRSTAKKVTDKPGWEILGRKNAPLAPAASKVENIFDKYEKIGNNDFYRYGNNLINLDKISSIQLKYANVYRISVVGRHQELTINGEEVEKLLDKLVKFNNRKPSNEKKNLFIG